MTYPSSLLAFNEHRPLTQDESYVFLNLLGLADNPKIPKLVSVDMLPETILDIAGEGLSNSFPCRVMTTRLSAMRPDLEYCPLTVLLCVLLADRVGVVVQWAYTLVDFHRQNGKPMTLSDWTCAFPFGPPSEKELSRLWDEQKGVNHGLAVDNVIDTIEAWAD